MEANFCVDGWGWNESSAGIDGDGSKTAGREWVGMEIKCAGTGGMGVISVSVQVSITNIYDKLS